MGNSSKIKVIYDYLSNKGLIIPLVLMVVLLILNALKQPTRFDGLEALTTLGLAAPLILASMASAPVVIAGGGGIDLSVAPLMGVVNAVIVAILVVKFGIGSPFLIVLGALGVGLISGAFNGFLAVGLRLQPIVATLGTALLYGGLAVVILNRPGGVVPEWLSNLSHSYAFLPILLVGIVWFILSKLPWYTQLLATGGDERAAYSAGINTSAIRFSAYLLTGLFAAVAGLALTAFMGSGDPKVGVTYTVPAVAAFALGGISLAGGRGTMLGAAIGGLDLFLLQVFVTSFNVSTFLLNFLFGIILVVVVVISAIRERKLVS